jgi:hypothetical protein
VLCFHGSDQASCSPSTSTSSLSRILLSLPNMNTATQPPSCTTKNPGSLVPRQHEVVPTVLSGAILSRLLPTAAEAEAASREFPLEHLDGSGAEQLDCDDVESSDQLHGRGHLLKHLSGDLDLTRRRRRQAASSDVDLSDWRPRALERALAMSWVGCQICIEERGNTFLHFLSHPMQIASFFWLVCWMEKLLCDLGDAFFYLHILVEVRLIISKRCPMF